MLSCEGWKNQRLGRKAIANRFVRAGRLVPILNRFQPPPTQIYAVYPSRRHLSAKVRAFVDFLAEHFAKRRDWC